MPSLRAASLRIRESFWFWPTILGVAAIVLAQLLVSADEDLQRAGTSIPFLDALSASGGRSILTTIGTSMLTVAGTSFSITISVLATTSSTYGPRLVRNFMADRANQLVLAAFTSTFLYAIVVLRSVHTAIEDSHAFVPVIAVHVAVLLGVADVAVLVFFIHHIATSVQVTSLQRQVQTDLEAALGLAFPAAGRDDVTTDRLPDAPALTVVPAESDGYVQSVAWDGLVRLAERHRLVVRVVAMPGTHVIAGDPLIELLEGPEPTAAVADALRGTVMLGTARTPYQDVGFALQQLVEIAVRGLASGTNDPYTAVSALDLAAAPLVPVWRDRRAVTAHLDSRGIAVVRCGWPSAEELVDRVFDGVLTYGMDHPSVLDAALGLAGRLERGASPARRGRLDTRVSALRAAVQR